jgi:hypothetical protein
VVLFCVDSHGFCIQAPNKGLGNNIGGTFPFELALLKDLKIMILSRQNIGGSIPLTWSPRMTSLTDVLLLENNLTGEFPALLLRDNPNLEQIQLGGNRLSGRMPTFLQSAALTDLRAERNQFTGSIPVEFAVGFDSLCKCVGKWIFWPISTHILHSY